MRDRGHLRELVGAVKQKEFSQEEINKAAQEAAKIKLEAIEKINSQEVKIKRGFLERLF